MLSGDLTGTETGAELCSNLLLTIKKIRWLCAVEICIFMRLCNLYCSTVVLEAENIALRLAENWACNQRFISDKVIVDNIVEVRTPGLHLPKVVYPGNNGGGWERYYFQ